MLNHVDRRRVLEQPAGKDLAPGQLTFGIGAFFNEDLNKGPGFCRPLPRQGPFAGGKPDDNIANPPGLARFQNDVLDDVVALVQQAQRGHPVLDRRAIFALHCRSRRLGANRLRDVRRGGIGIAAAATGGQQQGQAGRKQAPHGQASGLHAS